MNFFGGFAAVLASTLGGNTLCIDETAIHSVMCVQFVVCALFNHFALGYDDDVVGVFDGGQTVRDADCCSGARSNF